MLGYRKEMIEIHWEKYRIWKFALLNARFSKKGHVIRILRIKMHEKSMITLNVSASTKKERSQ